MSEIKEPEDRKPPAEPYVWTAPDGRTVTFKPFAKLPAGLFRKVRQMDDMNATFSILEAGTDEAGLAIIDEQPLDTMDEIFFAWSGVEAPES